MDRPLEGNNSLMKILLSTVLTASLLVSASPAIANVKHCKDFKTQQEAQAYYEARKKAEKIGWRSLDRDKDGRACDCNKGGKAKNCPKKN